MNERYCMVMTTVPGKEDAERLADGLLRERLCACVQMVAGPSMFLWRGKVQREDEVLLLVKTTARRYEALEAYIHRHHPYDVPEIIRVPVTGGFSGYLDWIDSVMSELPAEP